MLKKPATFHIVTIGSSLTHQWQKKTHHRDWEDITGACNSTYTIDAVAKGSEGQYRCYVKSVPVIRDSIEEISGPATLKVCKFA